jgi:rhamnosyl/mannosyltransferase
MHQLDAKLVVVGTGPMRERLVPMAHEMLGDRFIYVHKVRDEELADFYQAADLFCLPSTSRAEAFGISALEAMACGLPVITTELGTGTSVVNEHERTGLVVRPRDVAGLADAIRLILAEDDLRTTFGRAARQRAEVDFSMKAMLHGVAEVYRDVIASHTTPGR